MSIDVIDRATIRVASITPKTKWMFVELRTASGAAGVGEATTQGREGDVVEAFKSLTPEVVIGRAPNELIDRLARQSLPVLPISSAVSALDQAAWDLTAKETEQSVASALGGVFHSQIRAYANINRRTTDRTPEAFARSAADAIAVGHQAIKIAPFDEAIPGMDEGELRRAVGSGIARMLAIREKIGHDRRLMIDCHWRLDEPTARYVIDAAAEAGLYWVECPLPETAGNIASLVALRSYANARNIKLAGCEEMIRVDGFAPFLNAGAYDVLMPDVKYVGGLSELLRIGEMATKAGMAVSPHNPSGPICHAASLQVCAAMPQDAFLEMQFDEAITFEQLQKPRLPVVDDGSIPIPSALGLGVSLDQDVIARCQVSEWTAEFGK